MGLLDNLMGSSIDDPKTLGLLQLASSLSTGQKFVPALSQGLLGRQQIMQDAERQQALKQMQAMQMQQQQMAMQQAQRQAAQQKAQDEFRRSIPSPQMLGIQGAMGANGGPTNAAAAAIPQVDPNAQMMHGALQAGLIDPLQYITSQRKDKTPIKLGAGEALLDPGTFKPIYTNQKEESAPSSVKEYQFAVQQGYPGSFEQFEMAKRRAGASSVSVNTGQKGLDNTLKLRGDFRSEPVYKAHQEMESAYSQIQQALKAATPVGDLAGATKIMKLLDPGSVVRESELGMAMSATGLMDRVQNYASNIISGHKLTPLQRKEFQALADALVAQSTYLYNTKRGEYSRIAERNGLGVEDVVGAASATGRSLPSVVRLPGAGMPQVGGDPMDPLNIRGN